MACSKYDKPRWASPFRKHSIPFSTVLRLLADICNSCTDTVAVRLPLACTEFEVCPWTFVGPLTNTTPAKAMAKRSDRLILFNACSFEPQRVYRSPTGMPFAEA